MKPMLAKSRPELPVGDYLYEPKWDGFRCLIFRDGDELQLQSRNEKPLNRYFPELVEAMLRLLPKRCIVDGEIVIAGPKGLNFDALLQRVHPAASRVAKLSKEFPASFVAFDLLGLDGKDLAEKPFGERRLLLERQLKARGRGALLLSPSTRDAEQARAWFTGFEGMGFDGVVAKDPKLPYLPNQRAMIKVKHQRTADCVIGGYRAAKDGSGVASLLLGLYDDAGVLQHVGVAASLDAEARASLFQELKPLAKNVAEHPWRTGDAALQRIPGGKSRWSSAKAEEDLEFVALQPKRVVEVAYDYLQGDRFRHTTHIVRMRPDRDAASCTYSQLQGPAQANEVLDLFK
jgi:ATP-dependent DNA ligase